MRGPKSLSGDIPSAEWYEPPAKKKRRVYDGLQGPFDAEDEWESKAELKRERRAAD